MHEQGQRCNKSVQKIPGHIVRNEIRCQLYTFEIFKNFHARRTALVDQINFARERVARRLVIDCVRSNRIVVKICVKHRSYCEVLFRERGGHSGF